MLGQGDAVGDRPLVLPLGAVIEAVAGTGVTLRRSTEATFLVSAKKLLEKVRLLPFRPYAKHLPPSASSVQVSFCSAPMLLLPYFLDIEERSILGGH